MQHSNEIYCENIKKGHSSHLKLYHGYSKFSSEEFITEKASSYFGYIHEKEYCQENIYFR